MTNKPRSSKSKVMPVSPDPLADIIDQAAQPVADPPPTVRQVIENSYQSPVKSSTRRLILASLFILLFVAFLVALIYIMLRASQGL